MFYVYMLLAVFGLIGGCGSGLGILCFAVKLGSIWAGFGAAMVGIWIGFGITFWALNRMDKLV